MLLLKNSSCIGPVLLQEETEWPKSGEGEGQGLRSCFACKILDISEKLENFCV